MRNKFISLQLIKDLIERIPIESYLNSVLGSPPKKGNNSYIYFCEFHNDQNTPNLVFPLTGEYKATYHCFVCKAKGNIFSFHRSKFQLNGYEAFENLAIQYAPEMLPLKKYGGKNG